MNKYSDVYVHELVACVCMWTQKITIKQPYCSVLSKQAKKNELYKLRYSFSVLSLHVTYNWLHTVLNL